MNRKISLGLALSLIIITAAASFAVTMAYSQKVYNRVIPGLSSRLERIDELQDIESKIQSYYYDVDSIDNQKLNASVSRGYLDGLSAWGDRYLTAQEYQDYLNIIECKTRGIGIITTQKAGIAALYVLFVAPGSPAEKEGLVSGDEIIKIDGEDVLPDNHQASASKLQGMSLKTVVLTCRRGGEVFTANVLFGFDEQSVAYSVYGSAGYIKIFSFYKNTPAQLENAIKELTGQGVKGIIFDVRGTKDGTIEYAAQTADILVPTATLKDSQFAKAVYRDSNNNRIFASDAKELTLPMVVLINNETSGGAEFFAVSLVDFKGSITVGAKTSGNNMLQDLIPLESGSAVLLTVAKIEAYKTKDYSKGIAPSVEEVALTDEQAAAGGTLKLAEDPQFLKALLYIPGG